MRIRSLRTNLMWLFFLFFFVPYGLLTHFSVSTSKGMMRERTIRHLQNLVEVKETAIEHWILERVSDAKGLAQSPEVRSLDPRRIAPFLSQIRHFERAYVELGVFDARGRLVSEKTGPASFEETAWFRGAIEKGTYISPPEIQPQTLRPVVTISFGIRNGTGGLVGVLKEMVDLSYVSALISESTLGRTGEIFVVTPQGRIVIHQRLPNLLRSGHSRVPYFERTQPQPIAAGVYQDYTGNEVLGSWKWLHSLGCYLIAEQDTIEAFHEIDLLVQRAALLFVTSTLLILGISYGVIGRATAPIQRLSATVARFADGHPWEAMSTTRRDEIGKLIAGFNLMAGRLQTAHAELKGKVATSNTELEGAYQLLQRRQEQLVQSEKMAALGQLSAGIAHEIRNPLTSIKIFIQSLQREIDSGENQAEDFRIILKEIDRINEKITRFLNFARPEEPVLQLVDLRAVVEDAVNLLASRLRSAGIRLRLFVPAPHPPVEGDPKQLAQVLLNLLLNALEAMPQGGTLTIGMASAVSPDTHQEMLRLVVTDTGPGIAERDRPYLFDPFFTAKAGGTGLGLSIAYSIAQKHHGRIEVESAPGQGASFILLLPVLTEGAQE